MAFPVMSDAEIAELLDEAAAARQLAATFKDRATIADLLAHALALEADAALEPIAAGRPFGRS